MANKEKNFDAFLEEISKVDLLSPEEELQFVKAVQAKGVDCDEMQQLEKANARFIVSVANQYKNHEQSIQDLITAGEDGLRKAAMKYDTESDFKFLSYAVWWIRQAIIQAIAEKHEFLLREENYGYQMKLAFHFDRAREGHKTQRMALADMMFHGDTTHYFSLIKPTDKEWLMDLAETNHPGAIYCLLFGMQNNFDYFFETFVDDDTHEEVKVLRADFVEGSFFAKKEGEEERLIQKLLDMKEKLSREELSRMCCVTYNNTEIVLELIRKGDEEAEIFIDDPTILQELSDKGNKYATEHMGCKYAYGDEENGIYIDHKKAAEYMKLAGRDYDPKDYKEADDPHEFDYTLRGDAATLNGIQTMINELCQRFGTPDNEMGMFVPMGALMKMLVGSPYYEGNVLSMNMESIDCLTLHTEANSGFPLLYALRESFPNLTIEMQKTEW